MEVVLPPPAGMRRPCRRHDEASARTPPERGDAPQRQAESPLEGRQAPRARGGTSRVPAPSPSHTTGAPRAGRHHEAQGHSTRSRAPPHPDHGVASAQVLHSPPRRPWGRLQRGRALHSNKVTQSPPRGPALQPIQITRSTPSGSCTPAPPRARGRLQNGPALPLHGGPTVLPPPLLHSTPRRTAVASGRSCPPPAPALRRSPPHAPPVPLTKVTRSPPPGSAVPAPRSPPPALSRPRSRAPGPRRDGARAGGPRHSGDGRRRGCGRASRAGRPHAGWGPARC